MTMGNFLAALRARLGLTQRQFGHIIGYQQPTVSQFESGAADIPYAVNEYARILLMMDDGQFGDEGKAWVRNLVETALR